MRRTTLILTTFSLLILVGCEGGARIEGRVVDARGQALPGVAVRVEGTPFESLTNGVGRFRVRYVPQDEFAIHFVKTGYTPFTYQVPFASIVPSKRAVQLTVPMQSSYDDDPTNDDPITLIQLPDTPGVYLYENYDYMRTTFDTPVQLTRKEDNSITYGTARQDIVETLKHAPALVIYRGYKIPAFGARLNRLQETEVLPLPGFSGTEGLKAWTRGPEVPVEIRGVDSVDRTQGQLLQVYFVQELELGAYALHWGALDNDVTLNEPRIFCFKVVDEFTKPATEEPAETETDEATADTKPDPKKPAKPGAKTPAKPDAKKPAEAPAPAPDLPEPDVPDGEAPSPSAPPADTVTDVTLEQPVQPVE